MIRHIKKSKYTKIVASYLAIQLVVTTIQPSQLWALTSGPSQPEFNSFTPIGTSDMVNLSTGDFNYNIPIMDVGGYPLNLAYDSGITMDQEASWVGLGWNLNVGQIARNVRGIPDDFKGDEIRYENEMKDNVTVGAGASLRASVFGVDALKGNIGLNVEYNNYNGFTFKPSFGLSYGLNDTNATVGLNISAANGDGATVTPSVSLSNKFKTNKGAFTDDIGGNFGLGINSRQGVTNLNLSFTRDRTDNRAGYIPSDFLEEGGGSGGASISFNDITNFTPSKRVSMNNDSKTFTLSGGVSFGPAQAHGQISAYGSYQEINEADKNKLVPAFGYENTEYADGANGILDFNREKDNTVTKFTNVLPITNYSYDIYAIQGQGTGGTFRPFKSQVGYVYDNFVADTGSGVTLGGEAGAGNLWYAGAEIKLTETTNTTGKWSSSNNALDNFSVSGTGFDKLDYETTYFKQMGELVVDREYEEIYKSQLSEDAPIRLEIGGSGFDRRLEPNFLVKKPAPAIDYNTINLNSSKIKRTKRELRNHAVQKITNQQAADDDFVETHPLAKMHHTVGVKTIQPDGSTYVYGEAAYNKTKVEASFDVSGSADVDCVTGLVGYILNSDGSLNGHTNKSIHSNSNQFLNRITTPAYAHTYLLTSVLSSDYEDISDDGPTDDDLGAYTKFNYTTYTSTLDETKLYKWRIPFEERKATYNEGLKSNTEDEVGNYIYGEKELKYISSIETKTHIAVFDLVDRHDAVGVKGEHGGMADVNDAHNTMKKIRRIFLFSKPEYKKLTQNLTDQQSILDLDENDVAKSAIKIAHFEYDYSLCKGMPNNDGLDNNLGGKLTLEKVYFTYRGSNMGKYTPYKFNYDFFTNIDGDFIEPSNFNYGIKTFDIWGNYKDYSINPDQSCGVESVITPSEFPYVEQQRVNGASAADYFTRSWTLTSIDLPSGGKIEFETESDDYQYVQDKKAMSMLKIAGVGVGQTTEIDDLEISDFNTLYDSNNHKKYVYVKLRDDDTSTSTEFINRYLGGTTDQPIYFRFLLNMGEANSEAYDYVTGYFEIDETQNIIIHNGYAGIPMRTLDKEGGFVSNIKQVNPIAKAGWHFGRTYLNRLVYTGDQVTDIDNFEDVAKGIWDAIGSVSEIFEGPNAKLERDGIAKTFIPEKSWIRLNHVNDEGNHVKLGGGLRVKRVVMRDQWDKMVTGKENDERYKQHYGQEYSYINEEDGLSSGVATFEPNGSKENPLVMPFFADDEATKFRDRMVSPNFANYTEKPFGETFFPSPQVTYGRVTVKNLERKDNDANKIVKSHATGKVVTEFFTSKDFPTIVDYTDVNSDGLKRDPNALAALNLSVRNYMTLSQGFSIITNDMNGKQKSQRVYAEGQKDAISGVDYIYNRDENNPKKLNNEFTTIDEYGTISNKIIGQTYDVVNDFRENSSKTIVGGVNANLTTFLAAVFPTIVPFPLPNYAEHKNRLRTAVTTKVIHKTGIMVEKIAYDLGAQVSTKNLAWDGNTGQVLLTETVNEYDNHYFNFNYPAYWYYEGMGIATKNLDIEGLLKPRGDDEQYFLVTHKTGLPLFSEDLPLYPGDMVITEEINDNPNNEKELLWVAEIDAVSKQVRLMNKEGFIINNECTTHTKGEVRFKVVRSGYKNTQSASMASVTSQVNPIMNPSNGEYLEKIAIETSNVINASAVRYNDYWKPQDQLGLPRLTHTVSSKFNQAISQINSNPDIDLTSYGFNPYLYNARGEWRALESYAYLTGRNSAISSPGVDPNLRNDGFFTSFSPFYQFDAPTSTWQIENDNWTTASTVTKFSPYGAELENKDALNRYSSALYGYAYTLPTAVASNNLYREIAFDGFEDNDYNGKLNETSAVIEDINYNTDEITYFNRDHFSFTTLTQDTEGSGEIIHNGNAHTGISSYKVTGEKAEISRGLEPKNHIIKEFDCYDTDEQDKVGTIGIVPQTPFDSIGADNESERFEREINIYGGQANANTTLLVHFYAHSQVNSPDPDQLLDATITVTTSNGQSGSSQLYYTDGLVGQTINKGATFEVPLDNNGNATIDLTLYYNMSPYRSNKYIQLDTTFRFTDELGIKRASDVRYILLHQINPSN